MSEAIRAPADSAVQRELEPVVLARLAIDVGRQSTHSDTITRTALGRRTITT